MKYVTITKTCREPDCHFHQENIYQLADSINVNDEFVKLQLNSYREHEHECTSSVSAKDSIDG